MTLLQDASVQQDSRELRQAPARVVVPGAGWRGQRKGSEVEAMRRQTPPGMSFKEQNSRQAKPTMRIQVNVKLRSETVECTEGNDAVQEQQK